LPGYKKRVLHGGNPSDNLRAVLVIGGKPGMFIRARGRLRSTVKQSGALDVFEVDRAKRSGSSAQYQIGEAFQDRFWSSSIRNSRYGELFF